jgi:hypothetical protein
MVTETGQKVLYLFYIALTVLLANELKYSAV